MTRGPHLRGATLTATTDDGVCWVRFTRPEARNTIVPELIAELHRVLRECEGVVGIVVIEGSPEVFCFGADFGRISRGDTAPERDSTPDHGSDLYRLWLRMAHGPYVVVAHVRGRVNAGGVGFVAASDVVVADESATFSLSELLFGLIPAMVLPFLTRRIGFQKAHYMTLMTKPVPVARAAEWGLVDASGPNSRNLVLQHLSRLRRIPPDSIRPYKRYVNEIDAFAVGDRAETAVRASQEAFDDPANVRRVVKFVEDGVYPWET